MDRMVTTNFFLGICHMQVCAEADVTDEEILEFCNRDNPSGTTNGWGGVEREGDKAPVKCGDDPNRKHFLIYC